MLKNPEQIHRQHLYWYYLALFAVAFVAMLPVTMLWHPLKWDMIDQYFPWRYFIGESLQEGILPMWCPYQILGEPIHANPQSSAWYPVTWFFGYLFGYDIYIISYDYFLHIFLAGIGMFYLGRKLSFRNETAFMMAVAYMLSGFFVGNAQHMTYIVSGAWIPFLLGAFLSLREKPSLAGSVRLALILFLMLSGGYPSFTFILLYLLLAIFIYYFFGFIRKRNYHAFFRYSLHLVLAAIVTLLMSAVVIVSVYHLQAAMTRGEGVSLEQALFGAFTPQCMISFILPFAVTKEMGYFNTDLSMANGYFGLVPLIFFFLALTIKRPKIINLFLAWGVFSLLAAVGEALPVRAFLYHYIPFMDQFRFPAAFRVYVILSFLLVAGSGFDSWMGDPAPFHKRMKWLIYIMGAIFFGMAIMLAFTRNLDLVTFLGKEAYIFSEKSTLSQHIFLQSVVQLFILAGLYIAIFAKKAAKWLPVSILIVICVDMSVATRLNSPYTIYYHYFKSKDIYAHSRQFPDGFPTPGGESLDNNRDSRLGFQAFWRNMYIFHKKVSWDGYNPTQLKGYVQLADLHPELFKEIIRNPLVYQSADIQPLDSLVYDENKRDFRPGMVFLKGDDYAEMKASGLFSSPGDTAYFTGFSPVRMVIRSQNKGPVLLNLLQSNYHGWKVFIDGEEARIEEVNFGLMSVRVPAGEHEVVFEYRPRDVWVAFYVSMVVFIVGAGFLVGTLSGL